MLDNDLAVGLRIRSLHDGVDPSIQRTGLVPPSWTWCDHRWHGGASAVPEAADIGTSNDLDQPASVDVTDLDKPGVEDDHVRRMECHALGGAFPFDDAVGPVGITMSVDVQAEFIVTQQELIFA